jgi:Ni,Fe-hydrogenase maturation factor
VIFVDASRELEAGEIEIRRLEPEATGSGGPMTHNMSPRLLLAAARLLYGRAPEAWQAAMGGGEWDMGENLSPRVEQAFPALLEKVRALALREASEGRAGG